VLMMLPSLLMSHTLDIGGCIVKVLGLVLAHTNSRHFLVVLGVKNG